jgi:protein-S-isoprenylcysteine O-methyltransferase Ste14
MATAYHLMVLAEEPWLVNAYGEAYLAYMRAVPRYFHWAKVTAST